MVLTTQRHPTFVPVMRWLVMVPQCFTETSSAPGNLKVTFTSITQDEAHEIGDNPEESRLARISNHADHAALVGRPSGLAEARFWR